MSSGYQRPTKGPKWYAEQADIDRAYSERWTREHRPALSVLDAIEDAVHQQPWVASSTRVIGGKSMSIRLTHGAVVLVSVVEITPASQGTATKETT